MSLLDYMAGQTREYKQEAQQIEDRRAQEQAQRSEAIWAQNLAAQKESADQQKRQVQSHVEAGAYSEAKLREQQGYGVAETGDAYSDARLRDQLGLPPKGRESKTPLENYLGAVDSPESYRTAMMQYVASGGKKPQWYTGNYEMDQGNIETALEATMTPQQQLVRSESRERLAGAKESREASRLLREQAALAKDRENALKREDKGKALALKTIPSSDQVVKATDTLESRLGAEQFDAMPAEQRTAVARQISSRAKARLAMEGSAADYNSLVEEEMDKAIANGELKMGKEGSWFFNRGAEAPSFKPSSREPQAAPAGAPAANAKGWTLHVDSKGRRAYVSPDGKQFEMAK